MTLLDDWMPSFDVASRHAIDVSALGERTYEVARRAHRHVPVLVHILMGLRAIPAVVAHMISPDSRTSPARGTGRLRGPGGIPFTLLAEDPGSEFVLGLAGRFWTPSGGVTPRDAAAFRSAPPPGHAHAVWNFRIEPHGARCRVITETRVLCSDAATRARFLRYWRVVRFGSGLIRLSMLRRIRREAEQAPV